MTDSLPVTTVVMSGDLPATTVSDGRQLFDAMMAEVLAVAHQFGHRQHIHLAWLAVRRYGAGPAIALVSEGIERTARSAGAPQKYHATVTRAWIELVSRHMDAGTDDFDSFLTRHDGLLDKSLLSRHYRSVTLASAEARSGWVEPDLEPLPPSSAAIDGFTAGHPR
ncbi:hypothetical protein Lfu02_30650 [Longispora fulva]|uniref:Uncharacterized protein n=1 Tax=Longispora fulva TaxID=619741 RepID=A0A8J7GVA3_9ACTN|nr:hypothetical protein [Longispora fulva]MBG6139199.1 hypothetical protein [Longispora fulva]GIG58693.1 hypothetical protein Lfu02_30650 [Longispora fulva]